MRVEMDGCSVARLWLFGRTVFPVEEVTRLSWGGGRGVLVLTISYGTRNSIALSNNAFTDEDLHRIHKDVLAEALAAHGLEGKPLRPLFSESVGYIDIAEMIKVKHT
jgi:hypothetical protein